MWSIGVRVRGPPFGKSSHLRLSMGSNWSSVFIVTGYVGETQGSLKDRIAQHCRIVGSSGSTVLYRHFIQHGKEHLQYRGLEINADWSRAQRKMAERRWINTNEIPSTPMDWMNGRTLCWWGPFTKSIKNITFLLGSSLFPEGIEPEYSTVALIIVLFPVYFSYKILHANRFLGRELSPLPMPGYLNASSTAFF